MGGGEEKKSKKDRKGRGRKGKRVKRWKRGGTKKKRVAKENEEAFS